jgi:hypothetical protein
MTPLAASNLRRSDFAALAGGLAILAALAFAAPAAADDAAAPAAQPPADQASQPSKQVAVQPPEGSTSSGPDIISRNAFTVLFDARMVVANGAPSFVSGGFGKTRFEGNADGSFRGKVLPMELDVVWNPRFSEAFSANVSAAWQRDHDPSLDLIEAFVNYLPPQTGNIGFSGRVGLMWPEISLEHSTGGAWTVVNTITPSAINSWVGEEVKVIGGEGTLHVSAGEHVLAFTGGVFGWNDTSGTLLSFRGWALHDEKATVLGHFPLPPLNPFLTLVQASRTRNTDEIDHQPGWYARADWRPPWPLGLAVLYYDNRGDPEALNSGLQWGWRTRFWNIGLNANLDSKTKLLVQGMTGSTIMGFPVNGQQWVHTDFRSIYVLLTHNLGPLAVTGRIEGFGTREHGSEMPPDNSEDGWAWTVSARVPLNNHFTLLGEVLNVRSWRGTRVDLAGLPSPFESQSVIQIAIRAKL